ncbi:hypothetical protein DMENIID0001_024710 [Sergentomyia squamirostris]
MNCVLCRSSERDDVQYGEFLRKNRVSVHYYCLLLTTIMEQNGNDEDGIRGFLLPDILESASKSVNKKCTYCRETGANIACCNLKCFRFFHTPCGAKNNARYTFHDTFQSFCHRHIDLPDDVEPHAAADICNICCDEMGPYHPLRSIRTPCCSSGWFHRTCLAQSALSAGYFFRCPLCNDENTFRQFLVNRNVFIPDRDASWELAPQAFSELERKVSCDAIQCRCPNGRTANEHYWKMKICKVCGSNGIHVNCNKLFAHRAYTCRDCDETLQIIVKQKNGETSSDQTTDEPRLGAASSNTISRRSSRVSLTESTIESNTTATENKENNEEVPRRALRSRTISINITNSNHLNNISVENLRVTEDNDVPRRVLRSRRSSIYLKNCNASQNVPEESISKMSQDGQDVPNRFLRSRKIIIVQDHNKIDDIQEEHNRNEESQVQLKNTEHDYNDQKCLVVTQNEEQESPTSTCSTMTLNSNTSHQTESANFLQCTRVGQANQENLENNLDNKPKKSRKVLEDVSVPRRALRQRKLEEFFSKKLERAVSETKPYPIKSSMYKSDHNELESTQKDYQQPIKLKDDKKDENVYVATKRDESIQSSPEQKLSSSTISTATINSIGSEKKSPIVDREDHVCESNSESDDDDLPLVMLLTKRSSMNYENHNNSQNILEEPLSKKPDHDEDRMLPHRKSSIYIPNNDCHVNSECLSKTNADNKDEEWFVTMQYEEYMRSPQSSPEEEYPLSKYSTATINSFSSESKSPSSWLSRRSNCSSESQESQTSCEIPKLILRKRARSMYGTQGTLNLSKSMIVDRRSYVSSSDNIQNRKRRRLVLDANTEEKSMLKKRRRSLKQVSPKIEGTLALGPVVEESESDEDDFLPVMNNVNRPCRRAAILSRIRTFKMNQEEF